MGGGASSHGRLRCPSCGGSLRPLETAAPEGRWVCEACGGRYRLRRREGRSGEITAATSGEHATALEPRMPRAVEPPTVSGLGLLVRGLALVGLRGAYHVGTTVGAATLLALGGFIPVIGRWLRDELDDWPGVLETLGGVRLVSETGNPDTDLGPVLARADAPVLFTEIGEVARRLGAKPPGQVRLTYLPCCGVVAWGHGRKRALLLGMPLLHVLNQAELRAVLAHELAHLARGDATVSLRSARFVEGLSQALDQAERPSISPLRLWAKLCRRLGEGWLAPIARGQEARADRASAAIAGGDVAASALVKVALVQPLFREVLEHYDPAEPDLPNLYAFFRAFWSRVPDTLHTSIRHRLLAAPSTPIDAAHPALLDRLAVVQSYANRALSDFDQERASTLLGDVEAMEQLLHDRLFATGRVEPSVFHRAGS